MIGQGAPGTMLVFRLCGLAHLGVTDFNYVGEHGTLNLRLYETEEVLMIAELRKFCACHELCLVV